MRSRLLARMEAAIARARNPVEVACLKAERAGFVARQGHLEQARKMIEQIQKQFAWRPNAAVSAWISLAEGLHDYYSNLGTAPARDRIARAYALSGAAAMAPLHALSAAWLAHIEYVRHDVVPMAQHARQALTLAAPDYHAARARACLVVAESYHFVGRLDAAQPWYSRSRTHAVADGDEAHVSALMHNQASLRVSQARLASIFGEEVGDEINQALLGAESISHFDAGVGTASLGSLVPMMCAQVLAIAGRPGQALPLFERHFDDAMREGLGFQKAGILTDIAWCRLQLGDGDGARRDTARAEESLKQPCDIDDRACALERLAQLYARFGQDQLATSCHDRAARDLKTHRTEQARLAALLDETLAGVDSASA